MHTALFLSASRATVALICAGLLWTDAGRAYGKAELLATNLADLTLDQLSNIEVTSVSKRAERLSDAAASVFVITADDIRRSGATTLPEALRLAPNLQVARADANQYAITARGFNSVLANKILVLIDGNLRLQAYYDRTERNQPGAIYEVLDTFDVDLQHGFRPGANHALLWGASYRHQIDRVNNLNAAALAFLPPDRRLNLGGVFVQDEITLAKGVRLTAGIKLEHNDFTRWEYLPNARLAWKLADDHLLWAAASRTMRAPSRIDRDFFVPGTAPFSVVAGGPAVRGKAAPGC